MDERLDLAPCGYLELTEELLVLEANITFCRLLDFKVNGLRGTRFDFLLTRSSRVFFQIYFMPLIRLNGLVEEMYLSLKSNQGAEVPVLFNATKRVSEGKTYYDCVLIPLRRRMEYERHIQTAESEARKATDELNRLERSIAAKRKELADLEKMADTRKKQRE